MSRVSHALIVFITLSIPLLASPLWDGPPPYFWTGTYTIQNYAVNPLPASHEEGDMLVATLKSRIAARYPGVRFLDYVDRRDNAVRMSEWTGQWTSGMNACDLAFFAGHGDPMEIEIYDNTGTSSVMLRHASGNPLIWGGYGQACTKWVVLRSCEVLRNTDPAAYNGLFQGIHALAGYQSDEWQFQNAKYGCKKFLWMQYDCNYVNSRDILSTFASLWIDQAQAGWGFVQAWFRANEAVHYQEYTLGYKGPGIAPAVVTRRAFNIQKQQWFDGGSETFNDSYNGIIIAGDPNDQWEQESLRHSYVVYGSPSY